jgi:hypothetical protein
MSKENDFERENFNRARQAMYAEFYGQLPSQEPHLSAEQVLRIGSEFLIHFGVEADPVQDHNEFDRAVDQLNPRYKADRDLVRWELESDHTQWPQQTNRIIMNAADGLRMLPTRVDGRGEDVINETKLIGMFDYVVVLPAARQAPLDRALFAYDAMGGTALFEDVLFPGSTRKLDEAEQKNVSNYAPRAKIEFDLSKAAMKEVEQLMLLQNRRAIKVTDQPAHTAVIIDRVLSTLRDEKVKTVGLRLGAVTTQIYQVATALDVARAARRFGISETFVAGNPSDPEVAARRTPATYLSEVARTLKAAGKAAKDTAKEMEYREKEAIL